MTNCCPYFSGAKIFLSCPANHDASREWFMDTWNYQIVPTMRRLIENSNNSILECDLIDDDPYNWIVNSFPWSNAKDYCCKLMPVIETNNSKQLACKPKMDSITNQLVSSD